MRNGLGAHLHIGCRLNDLELSAAKVKKNPPERILPKEQDVIKKKVQTKKNRKTENSPENGGFRQSKQMQESHENPRESPKRRIWEQRGN